MESYLGSREIIKIPCNGYAHAVTKRVRNTKEKQLRKVKYVKGGECVHEKEVE